LPAAALLMFMAASFAAAPSYLTLDHSTAALLDKPAALAIWSGQIDDKLMKRLVKLYPVGKFGFVSQAEGGFTADKTCVVTARAMKVPRSGKSLGQAMPSTAVAIKQADARTLVDWLSALEFADKSWPIASFAPPGRCGIGQRYARWLLRQSVGCKIFIPSMPAAAMASSAG
jgi:hypothetical protein